MDTTETYIKMSDHPKVQEHSPVKDDSGFHCRENNIFIVCGNYYEQHLVDLEKGKSSLKLWLPRQDEIQGMMWNKDGPVHPMRLIKRMVEWFIDCSNNMFELSGLNTPEQIWLAFYMHEKHNLIWDGDRWKKK